MCRRIRVGYLGGGPAWLREAWPFTAIEYAPR